MRHRLRSITHGPGHSRLSRRRIVGSLLLAAAVGVTANALLPGPAPTAEALDSAGGMPSIDVLAAANPPAGPTRQPSEALSAGAAVQARMARQVPASPSDAAPTRVVIEALAIDLPVVTPPVPETYPYCDVAEYLAFYSRPGLAGVTYVYAHARTGMFLPLLESSLIRNGAGMLGDEILVYTDDDLARTYAVTEVYRHQRGFGVVDALDGDALVLQTSETSHHPGPKLVIVARLTAGPERADAAEAHPKARPRVCE